MYLTERDRTGVLLELIHELSQSKTFTSDTEGKAYAFDAIILNAKKHPSWPADEDEEKSTTIQWAAPSPQQFAQNRHPVEQERTATLEDLGLTAKPLTPIPDDPGPEKKIEDHGDGPWPVIGPNDIPF